MKKIERRFSSDGKPDNGKMLWQNSLGIMKIESPRNLTSGIPCLVFLLFTVKTEEKKKMNLVPFYASLKLFNFCPKSGYDNVGCVS